MAKKEINIKNQTYINRDISWLSFNYRVLQEAKDPSVPLFERIKFLAIYSSNLDEFFRVRVSQLHNLVRVGKKTKKALDFKPKQILDDILNIVTYQQIEFGKIFSEQIIPELKSQNIFLLRRLNLNDEQAKFCENYFQDHLLPYAQPVLLIKNKIRPFLNNGALYLAVHLKVRDIVDSPFEYAVVKIPSDHLPRFINLPSQSEGRYDLIMLDDLVRNSVSWLFPGYEILDTYSIKLTRDAELYIDDEFSGNLIQKIKNSLAKRNVGPASRFVYDREMPKPMLAFLKETFDLATTDLVKENRYHNNFDFFKFPDFGLTELKNVPMPPLHYPPLETGNIFENIQKRDHLLHFPYHSYKSVVRFFEKAATDPLVTHIKVVQYRVAKKSKIMNSLIEAVKNGKKVSVFIEVKARFDEEANLAWGEVLDQAGVEVHYSFPGVKVHSKLALVRRMEGEKPVTYCYLSTGNFHEDTAKIYSDFSLFTADERITKEAGRVFSFLETVKLPQQGFEHLLVGQFNLRERLLQLIEQEITYAKNNKKASIVLKMNSLEDVEMVDKLYEASTAGVKIKIIVRGICSLVAGEKGFSENIEVISIVDRFLEHSRIFIFHNDGKELIYLSSADWMLRNLSFRIETAFPILDEKLKKIVKKFITIQLSDNTKSRILDKTLTNPYKLSKGKTARRAQTESYELVKKLV